MRIAATLDIEEGPRIVNTIERAIASAKDAEDGLASFTYNDALISVRSDSSPRLIFDEFLRVLNGHGEGDVGPYPEDIPVEDLSVPSLRTDVELLLADAPPIETLDEHRWQALVQANVDSCGFGQSLIAYIERWARLMQLGIAGGRKVEDIAGRTSYEVDFDGVRPLAFKRAFVELTLNWKYGRELLLVRQMAKRS